MPIKFVWSFGIHHKQIIYSATGEYRNLNTHFVVRISATTNNHSRICGFFGRSSIRQSKLGFEHFEILKIITKYL